MSMDNNYIIVCMDTQSVANLVSIRSDTRSECWELDRNFICASCIMLFETWHCFDSELSDTINFVSASTPRSSHYLPAVADLGGGGGSRVSTEPPFGWT